jgi:hypothetical protein
MERLRKEHQRSRILSLRKRVVVVVVVVVVVSGGGAAAATVATAFFVLRLRGDIGIALLFLDL